MNMGGDDTEMRAKAPGHHTTANHTRARRQAVSAIEFLIGNTLTV